MKDLAPIVLFVYNRPEHTLKTIQALQKNILALESELFIYADEAKDSSKRESVDEVRKLICNITGFKKVKVVKQIRNVGLANSIISGVSEIVGIYGRVIVLEDDLVTSPYFLTYMNSALEFYSDKKDVWHISGWNYPIEVSGLPDTFLWRTMNCWGWSTWSDRWEHFEKNTDKLIESFSNDEIIEFNLNGYENFWSQILANKENKINTWAIYWYACIFKNRGLCLNPTTTYVNNIGLDGSGIHCGVSESYTNKLNSNLNVNFENSMIENVVALERIKSFYKLTRKTYFKRVVNKIARIIVKRNVIK
ncbi:glycosyltransferase [Glaciecola sp. HTCC2999]|uniref:glycosyltransferase n=1 Tax=Glaciecola sp. HTCC2999 TaxID=455436 RepID=UPI0000E0F5FD|nr:glycosyltransferase [Glaciecola sp. HTCC2999]